MSNDRSDQKPQDNSLQHRKRIKRRDLLLSASSLLAASAILGPTISCCDRGAP
jgi:hypothetical protein